MNETDAFTYHAYFHPRVIKWIARWGLSDKEIAAELGIPITMLDDWKAQYPDVVQAINEGRRYWVDLAESSLQKLIKGYDYDETVIELDTAGGADIGNATKPTKVKKYTRHVPPNASAIVFMLKNSYIFRLAKQIDPAMLDARPPLPR